jgi:hypothetical protein
LTDCHPTPDRGDRVGRALLSGLAASFVFMIVALVAVSETSKSAYYVPVGFLLLVGLGTIFRGSRRANIALLLITLAPAPWLADVALGWFGRAQMVREQQARRTYAEHAGIAFDSRSPRQVVEDLRKQGEDTWPAVHPGVLLQRTTADSRSVLRAADGQELLPLAGIANVDTVYGNEDGRYLIYRSDEHGFHNPPGIWALPRIDIAAVGDSFTQGASVPSTSNLVAVVRRRWPSTLNLGYGGNGPLIELASLLEYLPQRRPRAVLWLLCEGNDLGEDMEREMRSPLLQRYWNQRRNLQNLEERQKEIDSLLRTYVEKVRVEMDEIGLRNSNDSDAIEARLGLDRLRQTVYAIAKPPRDQWGTFSEVLRAAREIVRGWGGQLYLVYLPVHYSMREGWLRRLQRGQPEWRRQQVVLIGRTLDIPVIDLEPVFLQAGPKLDTFVYPYPGHFTAAGYEAIGRAIVKRLEADGL